MPASSEVSVSAVAAEVVLPADLHARPAGLVARAAARFDAVVHLEVGDRTADARSVLSVMGLGAEAGTTVTVRGDGAGAEGAVAEVVEILETAEPVET
jgi:phosphotransferase system HPr (HPr) family protein